MSKAQFHLPGLFEFYSFYKEFLPLFYEHREWFYDWVEIASIYGAPADCLWGGGRTGFGDDNAEEVLSLIQKYGISARLTFSNSLLRTEHLADRKCNKLCAMFANKKNADTKNALPANAEANGVIVHSDLLLRYIKEKYPELYFVSSTTKVLTDFTEFTEELNRSEFSFVVPDFRLNKKLEQLNSLSQIQKDKVEFLVNECCSPSCKERKICYENVSRKNLGEECSDHICKASGGSEGYCFSKAMENPTFISREEIVNTYLPAGFYNFKIEGRSLGSAIILEMLLYYLTKPEFQLKVREKIYLDSMLNLF